MPVPVPPVERAPLLRMYGALAERVAGLIRIRPALARRLVFAPPEATHAIAAYLYNGVPPELSEADVAEIIDVQHPRDLLHRTFPEAPLTLYRAFGRGGDLACDPKTYKRAAALAVGPFAEAFLAGDPLNRGRQSHYEAMTKFDPLVAVIHRALPEDRFTTEAVDTVIRVLRAYRTLTEADLALPTSAGKQAVFRRLQRLLDSVRAPKIPFAVPAPFRKVETVGALRREGMRFKNCVRDRWHGPRYWLGFARGEDVFIVSDDPLYMAHLRCVAPNLYALQQIAGPSNGTVNDGARVSLITALQQAGANIIDTDPAYALTRLHDHLRTSGRTDYGNLDPAALDDLAA